MSKIVALLTANANSAQACAYVGLYVCALTFFSNCEESSLTMKQAKDYSIDIFNCEGHNL